MASVKKSDSTVLAVRMSRATQKRLESLSKSTSRSKSYLAQQAIEEYLKKREWQIKAIEEGLKDAAEGRVISHEAVVAWMESWRTDHELPPPQCK